MSRKQKPRALRSKSVINMNCTGETYKKCEINSIICQRRITNQSYQTMHHFPG
uniref:Uncharacterized protein n=1 Tax=Daucus carota subsp. sativus TaxID=79200 RepID=A0A175YKK8_DAUCS